ncbi:DUF255 domain-containing protein [Hydrogenimonas sp. SS33]|uniref:thioredoxin family protein n=1 Tax=Hydrogenimonas leucolamina TaxID=2954236 RepID=UPI00336C00BB
MKKTILILLLAFSAVIATDFDWAPNLKSAEKEAAKENKLVFLMFSQKTCRICNYMKEKVFEDESVVNFITLHFVPVEIDINEAKVPEGFRVIGTPTFYILKPDGEPVGRPIVGGAKAPAFLKKLEGYIQR